MNVPSIRSKQGKSKFYYYFVIVVLVYSTSLMPASHAIEEDEIISQYKSLIDAEFQAQKTCHKIIKNIRKKEANFSETHELSHEDIENISVFYKELDNVKLHLGTLAQELEELEPTLVALNLPLLKIKESYIRELEGEARLAEEDEKALEEAIRLSQSAAETEEQMRLQHQREAAEAQRIAQAEEQLRVQREREAAEEQLRLQRQRELVEAQHKAPSSVGSESAQVAKKIVEEQAAVRSDDINQAKRLVEIGASFNIGLPNFKLPRLTDAQESAGVNLSQCYSVEGHEFVKLHEAGDFADKEFLKSICLRTIFQYYIHDFFDIDLSTIRYLSVDDKFVCFNEVGHELKAVLNAIDALKKNVLLQLLATAFERQKIVSEKLIKAHRKVLGINFIDHAEKLYPHDFERYNHLSEEISKVIDHENQTTNSKLIDAIKGISNLHNSYASYLQTIIYNFMKEAFESLNVALQSIYSDENEPNEPGVHYGDFLEKFEPSFIKTLRNQEQRYHVFLHDLEQLANPW